MAFGRLYRLGGDLRISSKVFHYISQIESFVFLNRIPDCLVRGSSYFVPEERLEEEVYVSLNRIPLHKCITLSLARTAGAETFITGLDNANGGAGGGGIFTNPTLPACPGAGGGGGGGAAGIGLPEGSTDVLLSTDFLGGGGGAGGMPSDV